jgi:hypothetical protein
MTLEEAIAQQPAWVGYWLYDRMGYVKLLGLPHIVVWTPLAIYLVVLLRRDDLPMWLNGAEPGWPGGHVQHM